VYIRLSQSTQEDLIKEAVEKAGSFRRLARILKIPKGSIGNYQNGTTIPEDRFKKIIEFIGKNPNELRIEKLEHNWREKLC